MNTSRQLADSLACMETIVRDSALHTRVVTAENVYNIAWFVYDTLLREFDESVF